jgi:nitrile hydratase accessory protein
MTIGDLPALPHDKDDPVFNEPWEAQVFALAVCLSDVGCFSWPDWVAILSQEIKAAQERGDPDLGNTYYEHWLNALERICAETQLVSHPAMSQRQQEWRRAYLNTPHGQPIELSAAFKHDPQEGERIDKG